MGLAKSPTQLINPLILEASQRSEKDKRVVNSGVPFSSFIFYYSLQFWLGVRAVEVASTEERPSPLCKFPERIHQNQNKSPYDH